MTVGNLANWLPSPFDRRLYTKYVKNRAMQGTRVTNYDCFYKRRTIVDMIFRQFSVRRQRAVTVYRSETIISEDREGIAILLGSNLARISDTMF